MECVEPRAGARDAMMRLRTRGRKGRRVAGGGGGSQLWRQLERQLRRTILAWRPVRSAASERTSPRRSCRRWHVRVGGKASAAHRNCLVATDRATMASGAEGEGVAIPAVVAEDSVEGDAPEPVMDSAAVDALAKDMFGKIALFMESELKGEGRCLLVPAGLAVLAED